MMKTIITMIVSMYRTIQKNKKNKTVKKASRTPFNSFNYSQRKKWQPILLSLRVLHVTGML